MANTRKNRRNTRRNTRKNNTMSGGKRKLSPYMRWANKERKAVMAAMPKARVPEIGKELGKRWRALSDAEKARA